MGSPLRQLVGFPRSRSNVDRLRRFVFVACVIVAVGSVHAETTERDANDPPASSQATSDVGAAEPSTDPAVYGEGVRSTSWRTAEQERTGFHLPPGFEVTCFASEPEIAKPLNLAFDRRGRIWMTQSTAYPYPAGEGEQHDDAVLILEDTDDDGQADRVTTFADGLNIPIGILPYGDGCLCFSIPSIWYLRDTDGDGVCDSREKILGPFDTTRDTHGLVNSLRDGGDGWIYACHGFNNRSEIRGTDGHTVSLHSGNTFRFRPDGSRVEQTTQGQVNPFGIARDDWGYFYSADCHSKPITQLIRGACYPSFGRPHDGLGFLPPTVDHLHGSTAISGIAHIPHDSPIVPLRGQLISGNVMTSRVNRNELRYQGATARGVERSDFLTSDDPWFRPVDIRLGPDGHIYIADFYNRIIGHYEVPLDHPGRDRTSGRIWRVRYTESHPQHGDPTASDLPIDGERSANIDPQETDGRRTSVIAHRRTVPQDLATGFDLAAAVTDREWQPAGPRRRIATIIRATERITHLARSPTGPSELLTIAKDRIREALDDPNPHVRRAAAEAVGRVGIESDVEPLIRLLGRTDESDPVLRQTVRIAIRDRLIEIPEDSPAWRMIVATLVPPDQPSSDRGETPTPNDLNPSDRESLASILEAVARTEAANALLDFLEATPKVDRLDERIRHVAALASGEQLERTVRLARRVAGTNLAERSALLHTMVQGRDSELRHHPAVREWASEVADQAIRSVEESLARQGHLIHWDEIDGTVWPSQPRPNADGQSVRLMSSHPLGESHRGTLRSDTFPAPRTLSFRIAGHDRRPRDRTRDAGDEGNRDTDPESGKASEETGAANFVRLVAVPAGEVIRRAEVPHSDTATIVHWDLSDRVDQEVRIECVDENDARAYAWIAIGDFTPSWVNRSAAVEALDVAIDLNRRFDFQHLTGGLRRFALDQRLSPRLRLRVAIADSRIEMSAQRRALIEFAERRLPWEPAADAILDVVFDRPSEERDRVTRELLRGLDVVDQSSFVTTWLKAGADPDTLITWVEQGSLATSTLTGEALQILRSRGTPDQLLRLDRLQPTVESISATELARLNALESSIRHAEADPAKGKSVFEKHCVACHQLRGRGQIVGPQLDGAVTRTDRRLLEDIVTPNANVDAAFRSKVFLLDDGRILVGVVQSDEGGTVRLTDAQGKTAEIPADRIDETEPSSKSLMPDNFAELLSPQELADLVGFIRDASASPESGDASTPR